jgi:hypothetical protein
VASVWAQVTGDAAARKAPSPDEPVSGVTADSPTLQQSLDDGSSGELSPSLDPDG